MTQYPGVTPLNTAHHNRDVAHRSADKPPLTRERRGRTLAHDPEVVTFVRFAPGEVVVVVHAELLPRAQNLQHTADDRATARVRVLAGDGHRCDVILSA